VLGWTDRIYSKGLEMKTKTFASIAVMSTLGLLVPLQAQAFGLGKIETLSALNEPFKAEVEITALRADDDISNIIVQLASNKEFERAGLERSFLLTQFKFEVIESAGQIKVVISSKQVVKEPFLDFLLTAKTGSGRLIREYTVLLDPPKNIFPKKKIKTTSISMVTESEKQPVNTDYQYVAPSLATTDVTSYSTDRSDTLWGVALKTRPEKTVSVHQMMMALLKENPKAFVNNNINGLKAGYTLLIPSRDEIKNLSRTQAVYAVTEQNSLWNNRNKKSVAIDNVEDSIELSPVDNVEQEKDATVTDSNDEADEVTARLKLVVADDEILSDDSDLSPLGDNKINTISEQLTLAQETIEGQTQDNIEINSRMDVMEEQIQTLRRLISLKDADLARLQSLLEEDEQEVSLETLTDSTLALLQNDESAPKEFGIETDEPNNETVETELEEGNEVAVESEAIEEVPDMALPSVSSLDDAVAYAAELSGVDQNEIQTVTDKIKQFVAKNKMEMLLGTLLLLILLWLIIRRANRPDITWNDAVEDLDDKEKIAEVTAVIETETTAENKSNDEQVVVANIEPEKNVENLIKDADVYISYDDLTKAKSVLEQALSQSPSNELVLQKLLHILYRQQKSDEFISFIERNQFDKESLAWAEIVGWGRELAPEHALFKQEESGEQAVEPMLNVTEERFDELDVVENDAVSLDVEPVNLDDVEISTEEQALPIDDVDDSDELLHIDTLDLDDEDESIVFEAPLSLDITSDDSDLTLSDELLVLDIEDDSSSIELEGLDEITESELSTATDALSGNVENDLEFDLDFDDIDEVATKLDLASAYVDMGDADGARSILEEVLNEGNDEQKSQAETLLDQLS